MNVWNRHGDFAYPRPYGIEISAAALAWPTVAVRVISCRCVRLQESNLPPGFGPCRILAEDAFQDSKALEDQARRAVAPGILKRSACCTKRHERQRRLPRQIACPGALNSA